MEIIDGIPHSPYFIFIKGLVDKSDQEILEYFNLDNGRLVDINDFYNKKFCVCIYRSMGWNHIMDNWRYKLWHSKKLRQRIEELGKQFEIFICSVGDADKSFDFKYYKDGIKQREYIIESPNYNDEILRVDYGTPLPAEKEAFQQEDQLERVIYIAKSLGIIFPQNLEDIRCYQLEESIFEGDVL